MEFRVNNGGIPPEIGGIPPKIGGKLVAPIGSGDIQEMQLLEKVTEKENKVTTHGKFSFVPMLSNKN